MTDTFDPTLVSAVLEADEAVAPGRWEFDADTLDILCWAGLTNKEVGEVYSTAEAKLICLFRTATPLLARRVMELEALLKSNAFELESERGVFKSLWEVQDGLLEEIDVTKNERDQLRERVAELEASVDRLKDR